MLVAIHHEKSGCDGAGMQSRLKVARAARGWSQTRLVHEIGRRAQAAGFAVMSQPSLRTALSRWENGHVVPDGVYRRLLREIYGLTDAELGLTPATGHLLQQVDAADVELRQRLATSTVVDAEPGSTGGLRTGALCCF